jgi:predicted O-methyltransferase YrrM
MDLLTRAAKRAILSRTPVQASHVEPSLLFSANDQGAGPDDYLIDVALQTVQQARSLDLSEISARLVGTRYPDIWPGEHYKLLAGVVRTIRPKLVIEVGTATGASALALRKYLPEQGKVVTFDIVPWTQYPGACLQQSDFSDGRLEQRIDDISNWEAFVRNQDLIEAADLIFLDAAKDGVQEQRFLDHFSAINFRSAPVIICDDIRVWNMLKIWRDIQKPKLDMTSFGHWSGTGFIHWI